MIIGLLCRVAYSLIIIAMHKALKSKQAANDKPSATLCDA